MRVLHLALFSLKEYFLASGLLLEAILTAVTISLFLENYFKLEAQDVYLAVGLAAITIMALTTYRLTKRETNAHIYMIMMRLISRWSYLSGKMIAVFIPSAAFSFIIFLLGFHFTRMAAQFSFGEAVLRLYPILMVLFLCESILLLFTPLVLGKRVYIAGLILICFLALGHSPVLQILPPIQSLIKIAYAPTLTLSLETLAWWGFYTALFLLLDWFTFTKRELNYEPE